MRTFIILGFLAAAASAGSLGYAYGPGISGSIDNSGLIGASGFGSYGNSLGSGSDLISSGSGLLGSGSGLISSGSGLLGSGSGLISSGSGLLGSGSGLISSGSGLLGSGSGLISSGSGLLGSGSGLISSGSGLLGSGSGLISSGSGLVNNVGGSVYGGAALLGQNALNNVPQRVELHKQFFHFSAPEEHQEEGAIRQQVSNVLKKNLQVIFIKAPENNAATNAALQIAKQAIEQKTAIYVLSKENDAAQVIGQLQQIQENVPTTPEVRIVRYRTPEDLVRAREIIQSQYNTLGGSSENINGGVAPVLNYASRKAIIGGQGGNGFVSTIGSGFGGGNLVSGSGSGTLLGSSAIGGGNYVSGTGSLLGAGIGSGSLLSGSGSGSLLGTSSIGGGSLGSVVSSSNYLPPSALKK